MININRHNYHEWMEAYLNNGLNKADMHAVDLFLQQNTDVLNAYLETLDEVSLQPGEIKFTEKANLSMHVIPVGSINPHNFTEYFINHIEGNLNPAEQTALENFLLQNPKLLPEFNLYQSTKLKPDLTTQYPHKKDLLKKERPAVPLFWRISAAASILMLVGTWLLWPGSGKPGIAMQQVTAMDTHSSTWINKKLIDSLHRAPDTNTNRLPYANINKRLDMDTAHTTLVNEEKREKELPVQLADNLAATLPNAFTPYPPSIKNVPPVDVKDLDYSGATTLRKPKKGLFDKIFSGQQTYIEDYVNAVFHTFEGNKKEPEKWILKVERDLNGKSKKIKFTSPIFSAKIEN
jgi:hypothetical protein